MASDAKKMSMMQLTVLVAVNMMGSGIIMLPTNMAQVGAISLLSWIVTALGSMAIAYGFAQAGLFNQRPGGMAAYAEDAYGKDGYFLTFLLYFFSLAIGNVAIAISAVGYLAGFFPWLSATPIATCISVIALIWLTTVANFGGPTSPARSARSRCGASSFRSRASRSSAGSGSTAHVQRRPGTRRSMSLARGHGLEHRADAVGVPRHGIGGAELRRGREPEEATCRSPACSARSAPR